MDFPDSAKPADQKLKTLALKGWLQRQPKVGGLSVPTILGCTKSQPSLTVKDKNNRILLPALLSCLLLPAPSLGLTLEAKLVETFHMMDLNQLYTVLFCLWFLALGAIEYLVLRWVWRRWFPRNAKTGRARFSGRDCGSLYGRRRQIEGPRRRG